MHDAVLESFHCVCIVLQAYLTVYLVATILSMLESYLLLASTLFQ